MKFFHLIVLICSIGLTWSLPQLSDSFEDSQQVNTESGQYEDSPEAVYLSEDKDDTYRNEFDNYGTISLADSSEEKEKETEAATKRWHQQALQSENNFRKRVAANERKLDNKLIAKAQKKAEKLAQKCTEDKPFPTNELTENIAVVSTSMIFNFLGTDAGFVNNGIDKWHNEGRNYQCDKKVTLNELDTSAYAKSVEHYMALSSTATTTVGYGFARNRECNKGYVVAIYGGEDEAILKEARGEGGRGDLKVTDFVPCPVRARRRGFFDGLGNLNPMELYLPTPRITWDGRSFY